MDISQLGTAISTASRWARAWQVMQPFGPRFFAMAAHHVDFGSSVVLWDEKDGTAHMLLAQSNN